MSIALCVFDERCATAISDGRIINRDAGLTRIVANDERKIFRLPSGHLYGRTGKVWLYEPLDRLLEGYQGDFRELVFIARDLVRAPHEGQGDPVLGEMAVFVFGRDAGGIVEGFSIARMSADDITERQYRGAAHSYQTVAIGVIPAPEDYSRALQVSGSFRNKENYLRAVVSQVASRRPDEIGGSLFVESLDSFKSPISAINAHAGVGGQFGSTITLLGSITTIGSASGGSVSSPQNSIDGDPTTSALVTGGSTADESLTVSGFSPAQFPGAAVTLSVRSSAAAAGTGANATVQYSLDGGNTFTVIYSVGSNRSLQTDSVSLPALQNLALVKVVAEASAGGGGGSASVALYEVFITVSQ